MNDPIYILRLPDTAPDKIYHVRGRDWITIARTNTCILLTPEITATKDGTDIRFVRLAIKRGSTVDLEEVEDPMQARVAGALIDLAFDAFKHEAAGATVKTKLGRAVKKIRFRDVIPPEKWKVFVCLEWPTWEREKTPWGKRAEQVEKECGDKKSANALQQDCKRMGLC